MKRTKGTALILAATALFAACSESDLITAVVQEDIPIGFSNSYVDCITRAEMTTTTLNTNNNTFMVWGWKTASASASATKVFNGTTVTYDSNSSQETTKWVYSPLKYWDRTASYNFYAASPANTTSSTVFSIDDSKKISATIPDGKAIQTIYTDGVTDNAATSPAVDYLVATEVSCAAGKANQGNASDKDVAFTFKHILSKFNVKVKTTNDFGSESNPKIYLKQLYVYAGGMCKKYSQTEEGNVSISDTWSEPAKTAYTDTPTTTDAADMTCFNKEGDDRLLLTSTAQNVASYLVCPTATDASTANNKVFVKAIYDLVYTEGDPEPFVTEITEVLKLKSGVTGSTDPKDYEPALPKFQQGYSYDLTVTVAPSAIYFDVESVSDFTAETGTDITVE